MILVFIFHFFFYTLLVVLQLDVTASLLSPAVPEGKPIFTAAHNASSTSLQLHWKPPNHSTIHGEFIGYRITLRPRDIPDPRSDQVINIKITDPMVTVSPSGVGAYPGGVLSW